MYDLNEVLGMSDRIMVLHRGSMTDLMSRREATQERIMRAAMGEAA